MRSDKYKNNKEVATAVTKSSAAAGSKKKYKLNKRKFLKFVLAIFLQPLFCFRTTQTLRWIYAHVLERLFYT